MRISFKVIPDQLIQGLAEGLVPNPLDDFTGKSMNQHAAGGLDSDPAGAQVINGILVQLADRSTVRA